MSLADTVRAFLNAIEAGAGPDEIAAFYAPDCEQVEYPNRLLPNGAVRDREALKAGVKAGKAVMRSQSFEVVSLTESGDLVVLEALWRGVLAVPLGSLQPGDIMTARFAQFFEFRSGLIYRQRNYDCFEPF